MTTDKADLFTKFLDYLESEPAHPEYLGEPPASANSFDPYQMVAEWTALRHEIKQQGKLLLKSQEALQLALEASRTDQAQQQKSLEENQKQTLAQFEKQQEKLLKDLLGIVDALDQACAYWQEELNALSVTSTSKTSQHVQPKSFWEKFGNWFFGAEIQSSPPTQTPPPESFGEIITSNQQGIELIQRSLLEILRKHRVIPIASLGKPFDSRTMYAVGREEKTDVANNTVIQEVVRGYLYDDIVLREAQVIVAARGTKDIEKP